MNEVQNYLVIKSDDSLWKFEEIKQEGAEKSRNKQDNEGKRPFVDEGWSVKRSLYHTQRDHFLQEKK